MITKPTREDDDRVSIADLERFGLPVRMVNLIDIGLGIQWVDQLQEVTEAKLKEAAKAKPWLFGPHFRRVLREVLRRFLDDDPVVTVKECTYRGNDDR